ncbi:fatty acid biosynthesis-containing protein transcriptional regulator [Sulfobacillus acidophilus TPY]|uniref:Beta-hydroxyacyl-(Acyl-carrier-protein) dehydratase FabA/FabZ n=1 Tax=Sulfobacillus acidophilus (strain ATCC 700253 / DSM 10332 / NAL) TaxID=679936 RepID=G8TVI3_SULAD|nr:fatty acid biosynthesis-containing protein transcriptional regulator [Sulfobacillus acidophilus TPY]AEW05902.1 Beta-hydroxyacyl-(acyl-carrier-protein) dehydratase FabA/FabZ [Sulfobacillus acidophilus DSM 10332]MCY0864500.1 transcription factor FapR [Sulfobacillus sp.]
MARLGRAERQRQLLQRIQDDPLQTDEELARYFGVSVPTIRLDRFQLGIPELRLRTQGLARQAIHQLRSLNRQEMVGDLVDLQLGRFGRSILDTTPDMAFERNGILRGHFMFAQADSLAIAVVDGDVVLTGLVNAKFKKPVRAGERIVATAEVLRHLGPRWVVLVVSRVGDVPVFRAKFVVVAMTAASPDWAEGGAPR